MLFVMVLRNLPLPPHAQGWQLTGLVGGGDDASTPAYAGLISLVPVDGVRARLYPRVRGADAAATSPTSERDPLPPHTQGRR